MPAHAAALRAKMAKFLRFRGSRAARPVCRVQQASLGPTRRTAPRARPARIQPPRISGCLNPASCARADAFQTCRASRAWTTASRAQRGSFQPMGARRARHVPLARFQRRSKHIPWTFAWIARQIRFQGRRVWIRKATARPVPTARARTPAAYRGISVSASATQARRALQETAVHALLVNTRPHPEASRARFAHPKQTRRCCATRVYVARGTFMRAKLLSWPAMCARLAPRAALRRSRARSVAARPVSLTRIRRVSPRQSRARACRATSNAKVRENHLLGHRAPMTATLRAPRVQQEDTAFVSPVPRACIRTRMAAHRARHAQHSRLPTMLQMVVCVALILAFLTPPMHRHRL